MPPDTASSPPDSTLEQAPLRGFPHPLQHVSSYTGTVDLLPAPWRRCTPRAPPPCNRRPLARPQASSQHTCARQAAEAGHTVGNQHAHVFRPTCPTTSVSASPLDQQCLSSSLSCTVNLASLCPATAPYSSVFPLPCSRQPTLHAHWLSSHTRHSSLHVILMPARHFLSPTPCQLVDGPLTSMPRQTATFPFPMHSYVREA